MPPPLKKVYFPYLRRVLCLELVAVKRMHIISQTGFGSVVALDKDGEDLGKTPSFDQPVTPLFNGFCPLSPGLPGGQG